MPEPSGFQRLSCWVRDCLLEYIPGAKPTWEFIKREVRGVKDGWVLFTVLAVMLVLATHRFDPWSRGASNNNGHKREIVEKLGQFLIEGEHLEAICSNPKLETYPRDQIEKWTQDLDYYIVRELGTIYAVRLKSSSGILPEGPVGGPAAVVPEGVWWGIHVRCVRLNEFLQELPK